MERGGRRPRRFDPRADRLYAAGATAISAIEIPQGQQEPKVAWSLPVEGQVVRLLAAGGKLFAVTLDGRIMAFGGEPGSPQVLRTQVQAFQPSSGAAAEAKRISSGKGRGKAMRSVSASTTAG